jgi:hypothetical protein
VTVFTVESTVSPAFVPVSVAPVTVLVTLSTVF